MLYLYGIRLNEYNELVARSSQLRQRNVSNARSTSSAAESYSSSSSIVGNCCNRYVVLRGSKTLSPGLNFETGVFLRIIRTQNDTVLPHCTYTWYGSNDLDRLASGRNGIVTAAMETYLESYS